MALISARGGCAIRLAGCLVSTLLVGTAARAQDAKIPLSLPSSRASLPVVTLLSGDATAWTSPAADIHLNRTPPLFETDPRDDGFRPSARVQIQVADSNAYVRLIWTDSTLDSVPATRRYPDSGAGAIYKKQSEDIDRFPDAACVMVPKQLNVAGPFPSLMMGDPADPVWLYYWREGGGFERLEAAGRGSTTQKGVRFRGNARHEREQWIVVFEIPIAQAGTTPLAFAIWNGAQGQRDGLKFYSLWYEVAP